MYLIQSKRGLKHKRARRTLATQKESQTLWEVNWTPHRAPLGLYTSLKLGRERDRILCSDLVSPSPSARPSSIRFLSSQSQSPSSHTLHVPVFIQHLVSMRKPSFIFSGSPNLTQSEVNLETSNPLHGQHQPFEEEGNSEKLITTNPIEYTFTDCDELSDAISESCPCNPRVLTPEGGL